MVASSGWLWAASSVPSLVASYIDHQIIVSKQVCELEVPFVVGFFSSYAACFGVTVSKMMLSTQVSVWPQKRQTLTSI